MEEPSGIGAEASESVIDSGTGRGSGLDGVDGVDKTDRTDGLEAVYRQQWASLVRLAYLIVGSRAVAEELVQESFVRMLPRLAEVENPAGFVRTTLVRQCATWLERRGMEAARIERAARLDEPPPLGVPEIDETWAALDQLRPERRTALVLRFYDDLPVADIADLVGCPAATVRTRLHRGLADLRKVLEP